MNMELDTVTAVSIISETHYMKHFSFKKLKSDRLRLQYCTSETVDTLGYIRENINFNNKKFSGKCYVLEGKDQF